MSVFNEVRSDVFRWLPMIVNANLAAWLNELRDEAAKCGYEGDIVAAAGAEEWSEYYYDGYSVGEALYIWAAFEWAAESWLARVGVATII